jgi:hypothetical protein
MLQRRCSHAAAGIASSRNFKLFATVENDDLVVFHAFGFADVISHVGKIGAFIIYLAN